MNDKFSVLEFIQKTIKNCKTVDEVLIKDRSQNGYLYERLWDICIKFGQFDLTRGKTDVKHYFGNVNTGVEAMELNANVFKTEFLNKPVISGKSGGYSDISFRITEDGIEKEYISSCKFFENEKEIDKYDLQKLCTLLCKNDTKNDSKIQSDIKSDPKIQKEYQILLFVNDRKKFIKKANSANSSSRKLITYISPNGNFENIYDKTDLERNYYELRKVLEIYNYLDDIDVFADKYLKSKNHQVFQPKFHQDLFVEKILQILHREKDNDKILVGAVPRSGKTYIIAGTVLEYVKKNINKQCNFVIITPAPTETIQQYKDVFRDYIDFSNLDIETVDVKNMDELVKERKGHNKHKVYIVSKQRLGYPDKSDDDIASDNTLYTKTKESISSNVEKYFGANIALDLIFLDEAHFGMTTELAKLIIETLNKNRKIPKIYITATYNKPSNIYNILDKNKILWDINDIQLLKELGKKNELSTFMQLSDKFSKVFGKQVLNKVLMKYNWKPVYENIKELYDKNKNVIKLIAQQYSHYPEPHILTTIWKDYTTIYNEIMKAEGTGYSFDMDKLFMVNKDGTFANEEQVSELLYYYFGYPRKELQIDDKKFELNYKTQALYKENGIMPRIRNTCVNNCRTLQQPHTTSQLWFLPYGPKRKIGPTVKCLISLLHTKFKFIFDKYIFLVCTDKAKDSDFNHVKDNVFVYKSGDIKEFIRKHETKAQSDGKEGVIILTAGKLQLGISLANVDIVCLLNNITSADTIYQMMFRSMTEVDDRTDCDGHSFCPKKKYGFIVDINPQRTILYIEYIADQLFNKHNKNLSDVEKFKLITDLFNIDRDIFVNNYDTKQDIKDFSIELFNRLNTDYSAKIKDINDVLEDFTFAFDAKFERHLKSIFDGTKKQKKKEVLYREGVEHVSKKLSMISHSQSPKSITDSPVDIDVNIMDNARLFLSEVIFIASLLTTHTKKLENIKECIFDESRNNKTIISEFDRVLRYIENEDETIKPIFIDKIQRRYNIPDEEIFNIIREILKSMHVPQIVKGGNAFIDKSIYLTKNKIYNITEPEKLLQYIHTNLSPNAKEKQERGEVFTNPKLIEEMLDKLPTDVWSNPELKWLDPAAGMGNFPVVVYNRLMKGLRNNRKFKHKSDHDIRKHILEEMLYMVEIDKYNVYTIKKIFCADKYKLNIYEGSFFDYTPKFAFDIIMGNPPFQATNDDGKRLAKNHNFWSLFLKTSFDDLLKLNGYICFITPTSWMSPTFEYKYIFYDNYIKFLNIGECDKWFQDVSSEFSYYIIKKTTEHELTEIVCSYKDNIYHSKLSLKNLSFLPTLICKESLSIIKKFYNNTFPKISFSTSSELHATNKKSFISICDNKTYIYPIRHTKTHSNLCSSVKHSLANKHKILMNISGNLDPFYDNGKFGLTQAQMYLLTNDKLFANLLKSKLYQFIFKICKWSGFNIQAIFENIPFIAQNLSDIDLYNLFKLKQSEIKLIEHLIV
jgi:hypothetical protein